MITVVIKTIGRPTLKQAVKSALKEGFPVQVVSDGPGVIFSGIKNYKGVVNCISLGKKFGYYGSMAANVGAALAKTPYIAFLDDDDVFVPGAGEYMRAKVEQNPEIDIWIAGVKFNNGLELCKDSSKGLNMGNVAMPTYRVDIFTRVPFTHINLPSDHQDYIDFYHVLNCSQMGYKVDWYGKILYLVRPNLEGLNGRGNV